jgi:allantoinase
LFKQGTGDRKGTCVQVSARQQIAVPDVVISAQRLITPTGERSGRLTVRGGRIVDVDAFGPADVVVPDSCVLMPGLVDSHVHVNEPGRTDWEGFASATAAAAAGGITTIVDMPLNSIPPTTTVDGLRAKQAAARGNVHVDTALWGGAVPRNLDDLRPLHDAGVVGFKCFLLPSGVDEFPPLSPDEVHAAMERIASFGGLLIAHAEDPASIAEPAGPSYTEFVASRPPEAEARAVRALLEAMQRTGCRTHIVHVSAAEVLPLLASARAAGLPVTAETCPHYLTLSAEDVHGTEFKCCPPIRDATNRDALWQGLRDGVLDCVVSDHSPCPPGLKAGGFDAAWGGIASVQLGFSAVWTEAAARGFTLVDVARWMSSGPARLAGLSGKGAIEVGRDADFAVVDPDATWTVDPARLRQRHPVTPYAGTTLRGVVRETWLRGRRIDGVTPRGRLLERG